MYLTLYKQDKQDLTQIDYKNLMNTITTNIKPPEYYKTTINIENPTAFKDLSAKQQEKIIYAENALYKAYKLLAPFKDNYEEQYYSFKIPKKTGGLRTINAPLDTFKDALTNVKQILENDIKCLSHPAAYAYTKQRSTYNALQKHQQNQSNWYLKIDLKDFFPSCTPEIIFNQLKQLYPFYYMGEIHLNLLKEIIKISCLNNGLPQGTPLSPLLTNLLMIPYDYQIQKTLMRYENNHYVYTRYADDILISSKSNFNYKEIVEVLRKILMPFQIKDEKTRYGSKAGRNWNLGLMLNQDNNITLGTRKKKLLNAMLCNFLSDFINDKPWSPEDTNVLQGQLSYLKYIEPDYYSYIKQKYEQKFNQNIQTAIKTILNPNYY